MNIDIVQVIAKLRSQAHELWPETPPEDFKIVRHLARPYSNVYRLQLIFLHSPSTHFVYAKIFTPRTKSYNNSEKYLTRLDVEFEIGQRLHTKLSQENDFTIVKPVTRYPEFLAIVSEEAPGESLANVIAREAKLYPTAGKLEQLAKHCWRAGSALAAIQKNTAEVSRFDPTELVEYVDVRLQRLLASRQVPFSSADRQQIIKFLKSAIPMIPAEQLGLCGTHGDYAPFNVLASPEKITVADFTMFKAGSVYNDVTYFYHRLEGYLHKPFYRPQTIRHLQQAFLNGYVEASSLAKSGRGISNDLLFKVFLIKHVVNNYSAIMRQRVASKGKNMSFSVQLFNRHVFRRYNRWLNQFCQ
jgi:hypothetical protein